MSRTILHSGVAMFILIPGMAGVAAAQGVPPAVSAVGSASAMAITVQGTLNGIPVQSSDVNNAPFLDWTPYGTGTAYGAAQLTGVRSVEMNLTAPGTVTFTSLNGNAMTLPYTTVGVYQLPLVPARVDLGAGAAATLWMLH